MVRNELKRLFSNKLIIFFILAFFMVIILFHSFLITDKNINFIKNAYDTVSTYDKSKMSEKSYEEFLLANLGIVEGSRTLDLENRDSFIDKKIKGLEDKAGLSIISDNERASLLKEKELLLSSKSQSVEISYSNYFKSYLDNNFYVLLSFIFLTLVLFYYIFYLDIDLRLLNLFKTFKSGLGKLYWVKLSSFVIILALISFVWISIDLIFLKASGTDLSLNLQNVGGFFYSPEKMNLLTYALVNVILKILSGLVFMGLFMALVLISKSILFSFLATSIFFAFEYYTYIFISPGSGMEVLKYLNVFNIIYYPFSSIRLLGNSSILLQPEYWTLLAASITLTITTILSRIFYGKKYVNKIFKFSFIKSFRIKNIFFYEFFDLFFRKKAVFVIFLLCLFSYNRYEDFNIAKDNQYTSMSRIKSEYYGKIDRVLLDRLEKDLKKSESDYKRLSEILSKQNISDEDDKEMERISSSASKFVPLNVINEEIKIKIQNGADAYVDSEAYDVLHSASKPFTFYVDTIGALILILGLLSTYVSFEYRSRLSILYKTMKENKRRITIRLLCLYAFAIMTFLVFLLTQFFKVKKIYPLVFTDIAINNLFNVSSSISYNYFVYLNLFAYLVLIISFVNLGYLIAKYNSVLNSIAIGLGGIIGLMGFYSIGPSISPLSIIRFEIFNINYLYYVYIIFYCILNFFLLRKIYD